MSTVKNPIRWHEFDIKKGDLLRLLKNANCDTDAASITYYGTNGIHDAEFSVMIVKGRDQVKHAALLLEHAKLYTPGKPINPAVSSKEGAREG